MPKIKLLPIEEAKKIAAGEVIERPANAFKELVENSIDAGAKNITIYLEDAGKKLIHIIDDGCGMSEEDAELCIEPHATSKIRSIEDLDTIQTFGFRGEALAAISSVSTINLITKEENSKTGINFEIQNGSIIKKSVVSANRGTDIAIKDLFWNVPARKKFLKSKETEWRAIVQIFYAFCLNYIDINFKLFHNDKLVYNCPAVSNLKTKLSQIYDTNFIDQLLLFDSSEKNLSLTINGAISNPSYNRFDRNQIFFFVNKRWVKNYKLSQAIIKGYQNVLPPKKYPASFIFITIDSREIDINIHPRKEEIQFLHPKNVENLIENRIKQRLEEYINSGFVQKTNSLNYILPTTSKINTQNFVASNSSNLDSGSDKIAKIVADSALKDIAQVNNIYSGNSSTSIKEIKSEQDFLNVLNLNTNFNSEIINNLQKDQQISLKNNFLENISLDYKIVGQLFFTYIIIQTDNKIAIIDQHAAHERIVYEKLKKQFNTIETVKLIFPQVINLSENDLDLINQFLNLFCSFGIIIEQMGKNQLCVLEMPVFLKNQSLEDVIKQSIALIIEHKSLDPEKLKFLLIEKIHAQLSCKASIKAGEELSLESARELLKDFYATENNLTCPHGRPTTWILAKTEIEKKFKRDYR